MPASVCARASSSPARAGRALARWPAISVCRWRRSTCWRRRYTERGIEGLRSQSLPGRRSQIDRRRTGTILRAGRARGAGGMVQSVAAVARATRVSRATVRRLWDQHGLSGAARARGTSAREVGLGACTIVGIFIDPPLRVLARVAPTDRTPDARAVARAASRRTGRRSHGRERAADRSRGLRQRCLAPPPGEATPQPRDSTSFSLGSPGWEAAPRSRSSRVLSPETRPAS